MHLRPTGAARLPAQITDTAVPSGQLQLVGSSNPASLDVQYADPNGGAPVTITYSWDGQSLTPSGTPPGH
jgi:hypothetical protein